jgi:hypothetical protein
MNVRIDASAPAWDRLSPNVEVIIGKITTTTALNKCSVICAVQLAARRPQLASGKATVWTFSALDNVQYLGKVSSFSYGNLVAVATFGGILREPVTSYAEGAN